MCTVGHYSGSICSVVRGFTRGSHCARLNSDTLASTSPLLIQSILEMI
jgi:hypothetical protein